MKNLFEVIGLFFKLGIIGFGGPAAHIAMMEDEVVEKKKWMDRQSFLDLIGATNLIPGPNSTEMALHCGYHRAGILGLIAAGFFFILPAITITGFLAFLYTEYGELPEVTPFIYGIKAAVISIIFQAMLKLWKKAYKGIEYGIIALLVFALSFIGFDEITVILAAGVIGGIYFSAKVKSETNYKQFIPLILAKTSSTALIQLSNLKIFFTFLKIGAILYGSGYVLFAYVDAELVTNGILTRAQLSDAIAVGQFTPGPVLSTATFIGYQLNGISGALLATIGIFLPSFIFVLILNPLIPKMRKSVFLSGVLDSLNISAVAIIAVVLTKMSFEVMIDWKMILIALLSVGVVLIFKKLNSLWIVLLGSISGYVLSLI